MQTLVASNSDQVGRQIQAVLSRAGIECPPSQIVSLEAAADRASRLMPHLLVLALPDDPTAALVALRETCQTVHNVYVLMVGPGSDPKLILQCLHGGAQEYLDEANLETELSEALVRAKTRRTPTSQAETSGRVISVLAPSGGSGSSTVAVNLSSVLAGKRGECGLIDFRLAAGDLAAMLDLNPVHTLADLSDRLDRLDQTMFEQLFAPHRSGVRLLAAPRQFADIEKVTERVVRRTLSMARVRFPYVVVDLENAFDARQVEALWQSDVVLLVLRLDYTSIRNTRRAIDNLVELGIGHDRVRLVANSYRQRKQLGVRQAEEALGMKIGHYVPHDPARINRAINKGVPVVLHCPGAKVSRSIADLGASVNGRHP